jgi:hypothetical protein
MLVIKTPFYVLKCFNDIAFLEVITDVLIGHKDTSRQVKMTGRLHDMLTRVYGTNEDYCQGASLTRCWGWALL